MDSAREKVVSTLESTVNTFMEKIRTGTPAEKEKQVLGPAADENPDENAAEGTEQEETPAEEQETGKPAAEETDAEDSTAEGNQANRTATEGTGTGDAASEEIPETATAGETDSGDATEEAHQTEDSTADGQQEEKTAGEEAQTEEASGEAEAGNQTAAETVTEVPVTTETVTVNPTGTERPESSGTGGSWGTVLLVVLAIVAVGAALAAFLLRKKQKPGAVDLSATEVQDVKTAVHQEANGLSISCGMAQTIGKREQQQDSLYCSNWKDPQTLRSRGFLAAVADGIGGLKDGSLASQSAMQAMRAAFQEDPANNPPPDRLLTYAAAAQKSVLRLNETSNCGATLVTVLITGKSMHFLSIGDSRIYLYRAGALLQLNREHILQRQNAEKEQLYGRGEQLTKKRAGALTSYLGKENLTQIDRSLQPMSLLPGDRIALMSDGVFNIIPEQELIAHLRRSPETAAKEIIQSVDAHNHPSQDNASVVVIGIE